MKNYEEICASATMERQKRDDGETASMSLNTVTISTSNIIEKTQN